MSEDFRGLMLATCVALGSLTTPAQNAQPAGAAPDLLAELKHYPHNILIETKRDGNWEIYRINADGSDLLRLTQQPAWDSSPVWVSGGRIVFESQRDGSPDLYIMDGDGTHIRRLTFGNARDREPS